MNLKQSLSSLARASIDERLRRVFLLLPLAATKAKDDIEYVHQLRIATRQALAALDTFEKLMEEKDRAWLRKRMKMIRAAAGDARDLDVMLTRFRDSKVPGRRSLVRFLHKKRRDAQKPLVKLSVRLNHYSEFEARAVKCLNAALSASDHQVSTWAIERIQELVQSFVQSRPRDPRDAVAFHHFRVQAKKLRYALELFSELGSTRFVTDLCPRIRRVQQQLGELNDHVVAANRLAQLSYDAKSKRCAELLSKLSVKEHKKAKSSGKRFLRWWTDERSAQVKTAFDDSSF